MFEMTAEAPKIAVVLLAAGLSRRMGERNKLLIPIGGEPLVRRVAKVYLQAASTIIHVVLGHEAGAVRAALKDLPLSFVDNPHYSEGQPTSVRAGIESVSGDFDAVVIALGDQAALTAEDISNLLRAFAESGGDRILIPYYCGRRGNPVIFPQRLISRVRAEGRNYLCRQFIDGNPGLVRRHEAANDHFVIDIDTPEDLDAFQIKNFGQSA